MSRTYVIMEAAACHDGDLAKALRLVDLARAIRADAVKFQWTSSPSRIVERRRAEEYRSAYELLAFPREWFPLLLTRCFEPQPSSWMTDPPGTAEPPVDFMCTVYLPEDVPAVAPYVTRFKVASFEAADRAFLTMHAEWPRKPLIVSAGMGRCSQVLEALASYRIAVQRITARYPTEPSLLYCVSAYPCPLDQAGLVNLHVHPGYQYPFYAGYSDHTADVRTGGLAVAAGARIVEFHARLDATSPENADYRVALAPREAAEYVANLRQAEAMLGERTAAAQPCETPMLRYCV